ncbi:ATP-binding protein [Streptomyces niveus]
MSERLIHTVRGIAYLTSNAFVSLASILTLLVLAPAAALRPFGRPGRTATGRVLALAGGLVDWERRRAGIVLRRLLPTHGVPTGRTLTWLALESTAGLGVSLVAAYLLLGGLNAITFPLWWAAIDTEPVSPLPGIVVADWGTAALIPLIGLAYAVVLLAAGRYVARRAATASMTVLGVGLRTDTRRPATADDVTVSGAVLAHSAEISRIERALHDGTQARLVNAGMMLGLVKTSLRSATPEVTGQVDVALGEVNAALGELRTIIESVYPPVLSDRGLEGAVRSLAAGCGVPCEVTCEALGHVPAAVEAAAYFTVAECLTNAVKHSGCSRVEVRLSRDPDRLFCEVTDDGRGGAPVPVRGTTAGSPGPGPTGTGLGGIAERVEAFAGGLSVTSPPGGPTRIAVELPCVS